MLVGEERWNEVRGGWKTSLGVLFLLTRFNRDRVTGSIGGGCPQCGM